MTVGRVAQLLALLGVLGCATGTHFRYGVIRWWVGPDSLSNVLDASGNPVYQAVFEIKGAWRRDYSWGALYNEQWRDSVLTGWRQAPTADGNFDCADVAGTNNPTLSGIQCFEGGSNLVTSAQEYSQYQIRFPTGVGFQGLEMPPSNLQCTSPLHKGSQGLATAGKYGGPGPTLGVLDASTPSGYWAVAGKENKVTLSTDDDFDTDMGALYLTQNISDAGVCGPWAETYGFFFGDSEYSEEVVVSVTDVDFDGGLVGNVLRATSTWITHNYSFPYDNSVPGANKPWVAYWTGGNRITQLQNNADGRYRLEIDVRFLTTNCLTTGCQVVGNKSPIVAQIPVMPVVYTSSGVATFQVAAYDPDYGERKDQVRFFVGDQQEHGYILANYIRYREAEGGVVKEVPTYYEDVYHLTICEKGVGEASVCTDANLVGPNKVVIFGPDYAGNGNLTAEGLNSSALYSVWDPTENYAHPPKDINGNFLTIGNKNGMVEWEVGTDPMAGLAPGFYQVTIMVEERFEHSIWQGMDPDTSFRDGYQFPGSDYYAGYDAATGLDMVGGATFALTPTTKGAGPKVPVDFMMYLYPSMHYCSSNCDRSSSGNIMQTFESVNGLYGDPATDSRPGDGLQGPGTGSCKICGGGGQYTSTLGDSGMVYDPVTKDSLTYCQVIDSITTAPVQTAYARGYDNETGVEELGLWRSTLQSDIAWKDYSDPCNIATTTFSAGLSCVEDPTCTTQWTFQGCLGVSWDGATSIVPYDGNLETCQINNPPRFVTECDCGETQWLTETGSPAIFTPSAQNCLYNMNQDGTEPVRASFGSCCSNPTTALTADTPSSALYNGMFYPGTVRGILGQKMEFDLVATDDDQCVELVIGDTGLPSEYMNLEPHIRIDQRTVSRRFTFNPPSWVNGTAEVDPRQTFSKVCFYVTDKYLITAYPFHCLHLELVPPVNAKWCDEDASDGNPAPDASPTTTSHTLEQYKVLRAYIGEQVELPMCVYKSETTNVQHIMDILPVLDSVPGDYPNLYNFSYPMDSVNFPPQFTGGPTPASIAPVTGGWYFTDTLDGAGNPIAGVDPYYRTWVFTPDSTQECVYTVCFRGADIESADLDNPEVSPTQFTSVRCYRIEVYNSVLEFSGESEVQAMGLSEEITISDGFSMSVWAMPECVSTGTNMTLMYFGSTRHFQTQQGHYFGDHGLPIRNGLKWAQTGEEIGRFYYEDWRVGIKASPAHYACDAWHFVAFTVTEAHQAMLYVDGEKKTKYNDYSQHVGLSTQLSFMTMSRPDTPDDVTPMTGRFAVGSYAGEQNMVGQIDDIYVWNRALSSEEVGTVMTSRTLAGNDDVQEALVAYFPMRDGSGSDTLPLPDYSGNAVPLQLASTGDIPPVVADAPTPVVAPCVLGLEMPVGPTDGLCHQKIYGWNFASGPFVSVKFGNVVVPATFVNMSEVTAVTPGYFSPRFVSVTGSNNGVTYTNEAGVGRQTKFLYLDAGLYMDGAGGGALADSVCQDLPDRSVTFGAWVCVDCGQPVVHYEAPDPGSPNPEAQGRPEPPVDQILQPLLDLGMDLDSE